MINLHPTKCNICGGKVVYTTNDKIYGKKYGSGYCYLCMNCRAYVGTHRPWPREALGLLADRRMRNGKIVCHKLFDKHWKGKRKARKKQDDLHYWLAEQLGIPVSECHFGYFDLEMLKKAYRELKKVESKKIQYDKYGKIYFVEVEA